MSSTEEAFGNSVKTWRRKAYGSSPYAYLVHVVRHLPAATGLADVEALLPWRLTPEAIAVA